ncbi:MAG: peroxiredoxin [Desulfarculaceae bacterium]|nr:peroxiredoxin [Desulfarculaceae bacterium]
MKTVLMILALAVSLAVALLALAGETSLKQEIFQPGKLKPVDSKTALKPGDKAPEFTLPGISGKKVSLAEFRGKKIVVLSFVPAAFTPVCSGQWPGYNLAEKEFTKRGAVVLGISEDNTPSQFAWVQAMDGLWFPVLSDFWPHGKVASAYGVLRSNGTAERALFVIDRDGIIRYIDVHDINQRPDLGVLMAELDKLNK